MTHDITHQADWHTEARAAIVDVFRDWEQRNLALPGWTVELDDRAGCYRATFTMLTQRRYSFNEAELCQYVIGMVDIAPARAGHPAARLAEDSREEPQ